MEGARVNTAASYSPSILLGRGRGQLSCLLRRLYFLALAATLIPVTYALVQPEPKPKLISLALIPHHEQVRRRKLEYARLNRTWLEEENVSSDIHRKSGRRTKAQVLSAMYQSSALDNEYGTHYVDLWCGTPTPRRQTVLVNGGSFTAFPCLGCTDCGDDGHHTDALYNQRTSASFHALTCTECSQGSCDKSYDNGECRIGTDGDSWSAFEAVDICYVGGPHDGPLAVSTSAAHNSVPPSSSKDVADPGVAGSFAFPLTFGCQMSLSKTFRTQLADGILGMGNYDTAFWNQMHTSGKLSHKAFSLCYTRQPRADRRGTEAGAMTLGGSDPRLHKSPMVYTSAPKGFSGDGYYPVYVRRVYLRQGGGGDSVLATTSQSYFKIVPVDMSEVDLNKGTLVTVEPSYSDSSFSSLLSGPFATAWRELTGRTYNNDYVSLTADQVDQLPTILFQLQGDELMNGPLVKTATAGVVTGLAGSLDPAHPLDVIVAIPPSHYMEYDASDGSWAARFFMVDEDNTLGISAMMGHDVMFDVANNRIGWAESHCDYSKLMETVASSNSEDGENKPSNGGNSGNGETATDGASNSKVGNTGQENASASQPSSSSYAVSSVFIALGLLGGILIFAIIVGRADVSRRGTPPPRSEYHVAAELEMATVIAEEVDVVGTRRYRDYRTHEKAGYDDEPIAVPSAII